MKNQSGDDLFPFGQTQFRSEEKSLEPFRKVGPLKGEGFQALPTGGAVREGFPGFFTICDFNKTTGGLWTTKLVGV